jgi:hypothetical protein
VKRAAEEIFYLCYIFATLYGPDRKLGISLLSTSQFLCPQLDDRAYLIPTCIYPRSGSYYKTLRIQNPGNDPEITSAGGPTLQKLARSYGNMEFCAEFLSAQKG